MMAAIFTLSWQAGISSFAGLICSTAVAWLLGQRPHLIRLGLYGFNGSMIGWLWGYIWPENPLLILFIPILSGLSTLLMIKISQWGGKYGLPALSFPFLIISWVSLLMLYLFKGLSFHPTATPSLYPSFSTSPGLEWEAPLQYLNIIVVGMALIWISILLYSRISAWMFLFGLGLGLGISLLLGGPNGLYWIGLYAFTTTPLSVACGGLFFRWTLRSIFCVLIAIALASIFWWVLSFWLSPLGLYPLTAPFNITMWFLLLPVTRSILLERLKISPVPLLRVSRPEDRRIIFYPEAKELQEIWKKIEAASEIIRSSSRIIALAGAGISTESGIPDYRSPDSYWAKFDPADFQFDRFLTDEGARQRYWQASSRFYEIVRSAQPNAGHMALVELERQGLLLGIITQNVDGLHHKAGNSSDKILEIHGTEHVVSCLDCHAKFARWEAGPWTSIGVEAPHCPYCHGLLKPDSILFGQQIPHAKLEQAISWIARADLLLVIGSSLSVSPVASFPARAKEMGARVIIINLSRTEDDKLADLEIHGPAGFILTGIIHHLKREKMKLNIRHLSRSDYMKICQVADSWFGDSVSHLLHPIYVEHFAGTSFVAERDGELVGFILGFISQDRPEVAYVHMIATDSGFRFQGIGQNLYNRFFEEAIERGCLRVMAITVPYNHGSISFHIRLGFSIQEKSATWENGIPVMKDYAGPGVDCLVLERSLADPSSP